MSQVSNRMFLPLFPALAGTLLLAACTDAPAEDPRAESTPVVLTLTPAPAAGRTANYSGTIRARVETTLAFEVGGRISRRAVDTGDRVSTGEVLFTLDPLELELTEQAASADLAAAEAALRTATADLARDQGLRERGFISEQALARAVLVVEEASGRRDAAAARRSQAAKGRADATLRSPASGVVTDILAQAGTVVAPGEPVALLAHAGELEVEVALADAVEPPRSGRVHLPDGGSREIRLREAAPVLETSGRTRRARFDIIDPPEDLLLGTVVRVALAADDAGSAAWRVPLSALDERGDGPRVWRVTDGRVNALGVDVVGLSGPDVKIIGALAPEDRVVALGTHLLHDDMPVRERAR